MSPRTGHKGADKDTYSSIISLASVLDLGWWSTPRLARLTPGTENGTN